MRFVRNLAGIMLTTAVNVPISLVTSIVLARWLTPEDRGLYAVCVAFATTLTVLVQLGWPSASIYRLRSIKSPPSAVASTGLLAGLAISAVAVIGALALEPVLRERFLKSAPSLVFYLILSTVPFRLLGNLFGSMSRGLDRFRFENWYSFALNAATLATLAFVLVVGDGALIETLWAILIVYTVTTTGLVATVLRQTGLTTKLEGKQVLGSLRFGMKTYFLTMAVRLHERQDIFVLAYLLDDPAQIAFFAIAKGAMRLLELVPVALNKAAYPQLAGLPFDEAAEFACGIVRQGGLVVVPACLALGVLAPVLFPLVYGGEYAVSVVPFLLLLPCVLFMTLDGVIGQFFNATNNQLPLVITRTVSTVVNLGLNFAWVPSHGIAGAAAAACASFALQALLATVVFLSHTGVKPRNLVAVRYSDVEPYVAGLSRTMKRVLRRASGS